ncbi:condensation domain-containing protein [Vibrio quintilis]|uniref:Dimodular nonribosomal peptide synthase n=1 Tax=Vibrio quintilis TaxID=1117707 RepID=A0A1M7YQS1_9VIBR|nr:condensation domain-containing protein [Vibrio quintilis]SHO54972.1 Dimodular nonribosomal peptide synthase [Vibrio quintilis]
MTLESHYQSEPSVQWSARTEQTSFSAPGSPDQDASCPGKKQMPDDAESLLWLSHQQSREQPAQYAVAYRFTCPDEVASGREATGAVTDATRLDTGRLITALQQVYDHFPALRTVYRFEPQAGLLKTQAAALPPVRVEPVTGVQQAVEHLLKMQSQPFDLAQQPGIQFAVLPAPGEVILGCVMHQILSSKISPDTVFSMVASLYDGQTDREQPVACSGATCQLNSQSLMFPDEIVTAGIPGLRRDLHCEVRSGLPFSEQSASYGCLNYASQRNTATQFSVALHLKPLAGLLPPAGQAFISSGSASRSAAEPQISVTVLTVLATFVARQLAAVSGQPVVRVCIPAEAVPCTDALHGCLSQEGLKILTLDCTDPESLFHQAQQQMQSSAGFAEAGNVEHHIVEHDAVEKNLPQALLVALSDPAAGFAGLQAQRVWLPALQVPFELTFAMALNPQGEDVLMLTTSDQVSAYAGGWLLEQLAATINNKQPADKDQCDMPGTLCREDAVAPFNPLSQANFPVTRAPVTHVPVTSASVTKGSTDISELTVVQEPSLSSSAVPVTIILGAFREALGVPDMTAQDDFFDMGGHSLIATRIIGQLLNTHQIEIRMNDLFRYSTAQSLAEHAVVHGENPAAGMTSDQSEPEQAGQVQSGQAQHFALNQDQTGPFPLSHAQNAMWTVVQKFAAMGLNHVFNIPFTLHFPDGVDEPALFQAFRDLLIRHSGLRTHFAAGSDGPEQRIVPVSELDNYSWCWLSETTASEPFRDALNREAVYGFDLAYELPLRLRFIRDSESGELYLSMLFHHLVLDEWSVNLMMDELGQAYLARTGGQSPVWRSAPLPFHTFAQQQAASGVDPQHLEFWLQHLQGAQWAKPIFGHDQGHDHSDVHDDVHGDDHGEDQPLHQPADQSADGAGGWVEFHLAPEVSDGLYRLARASDASLFNVVYAAIVTSLHLLGGPKDMVVGTPVSGRMDAAFFDTVGYFTTIAVHRVLLDEQLSVSELIQQVKQTINDSMPYTDIPVDVMESALFGEEKENQPGHMFEVMIQLHAKNKLHGSLVSAEGYRVKFSQVDPEKHEAALGLQFEVMEETVNDEPQIRVLMSYLSRHYSPAQVALLRQTTHQILNVFAEPSCTEVPLSSLRQQPELLLSDYH